MILIHTADLHLGITPMGESMEEEQREFIAFLTELARKRDAAAVLIAGDVYDRALPPQGAIRLYDSMVTGLCKNSGAQVYVIAGNHDGAERLSSCEALLKEAGLFVSGRLALPIEPHTLCKDGEETDIYMLPYFSLEEAAFVMGGEEFNRYRDAYDKIVGTIEPRRGVFNVLMSHCFVRGAKTAGSDRTASVGGTSLVDAGAYKAFDYVALGHLHRRQNAGERAAYAGTPLQYAFGETQKTVTVIDTSTGRREFVPVPQKTKMRVASGAYDALLKAAETDRDREDMMRIEVTDRRLPVGAADEFRRFYPRLLQIVSTVEIDGAGGMLTAGELMRMSGDDILNRFMEDEAGRGPTEREKVWFAQAMEKSAGREK